MAKSRGTLKLISALDNERVNARAMRDTEKGKTTNRYTIMSIGFSLSIIATVVGACFCFVAAEGLAALLLIPLGAILLIAALILIVYSLNAIACQRIVNRSPKRFIALAFLFVAIAAAVLVAYLILG